MVCTIQYELICIHVDDERKREEGEEEGEGEGEEGGQATASDEPVDPFLALMNEESKRLQSKLHQ